MSINKPVLLSLTSSYKLAEVITRIAYICYSQADCLETSRHKCLTNEIYELCAPPTMKVWLAQKSYVSGIKICTNFKISFCLFFIL